MSKSTETKNEKIKHKRVDGATQVNQKKLQNKYQQKVNDTETKDVHAGFFSVCTLLLFWGLSEHLLLSLASPVAHRTHVRNHFAIHLSHLYFQRLISLFWGWFASQFLSPSFPADTQNVHHKQ